MWSNWKQDLPASFVVFLVALPLSMGIALASGAPVATGLVTGIIGGIVVGLIAGAALQVSGPAAGLTVICGGVISQFGVSTLGVVVLIAGGVQLIAGLCRLGQWFRAVPPSVVHGMLSGIGVLIVASQLHVMVDQRPHSHGLENLAALPESLAKGLPLPEWETEGARRIRIQLLRSLSQLHERQGEIEREVSRAVTQHGSDALHRSEEDQLPAFAPAQQAVLLDLRRLREEQNAAVESLSPETHTALQTALTAADAAIQTALEDLQQHRLNDAEGSQMIASDALRGALESLESHPWAAKVSVLTIVLIIGWTRLARGKWLFVPPPLVAISAIVALAWALSLPVLYVEVPDSLKNGLTLPTWTVFEDAPPLELLVAAFTMAAIASAETLLCATAVDKLHTGPRTQYDRELCAQGIGNILCGCLGALPMTGVIVRSAANVKAGATSRLSTILHGVWLLLFVLALAWLLRMIPVSALGGLLVYIGFQLIDLRSFAQLWKQQRSEALIMLATLGGIVAVDLLAGVLTGIGLALAKLLYVLRGFGSPMQVVWRSDARPRAALSLAGAATFLRLPQLARRLAMVPAGAEVQINVDRLDFIDPACFDLLHTWVQQHEAAQGRIVIHWPALHALRQGPQFRAVGNKQIPA